MSKEDPFKRGLSVGEKVGRDPATRGQVLKILSSYAPRMIISAIFAVASIVVILSRFGWQVAFVAAICAFSMYFFSRELTSFGKDVMHLFNANKAKPVYDAVLPAVLHSLDGNVPEDVLHLIPCELRIKPIRSVSLEYLPFDSQVKMAHFGDEYLLVESPKSWNDLSHDQKHAVLALTEIDLDDRVGGMLKTDKTNKSVAS